MKKLVLILFLVSCGLTAQNDRKEKIKAIKTAYITEQLDLSSSEAEKFWPVYNDYEDKMKSLRENDRREIYLNIRENIESMSDKEANTLLDKHLEIKAKELRYQEELVVNLRRAISPKKILKLKKAEQDFKKKLLERFKQRKGR
jgi:adenylate kinase